MAGVKKSYKGRKESKLIGRTGCESDCSYPVPNGTESPAIFFIVPGELMDLNAYLKKVNANRFGGNNIKHKETNRVAKCTEGKEKITQYPVIIKYKWYSPNSRKDVDNIAFAKKFINDGLVIAGILENDSRKFVAGFTDEFFIDKINPRTEIEIWTHQK